MINFHILTLFPDLFEGFLKESILARAQKQGLVKINVCNLRDWGVGKHHQVDDSPYGGGTGMVLMMEPVDLAVKEITKDWIPKKNRKILLTPQGKIYNQKKAGDLAKYEDILLICGRYEGFDERIRGLVDEELSIGNYILNGGEVAAMAVVESVFRLVPRVLTKEEATRIETFHDGLLEYPQYTRPEDYYGKMVPSVLLSGNHAKIEKWRNEQAIKKTIEKGPDLLDGRED